MRIYNPTKSQIDVPYGNGGRLTVPSKTVSKDFMPNKEFLSQIVTSFDYNELALIVSGPFEISMCSQVSSIPGFVVNSVEEAIERFAPKEETKAPVKKEKNTALIKEEPKEEAEKKE